MAGRGRRRNGQAGNDFVRSVLLIVAGRVMIATHERERQNIRAGFTGQAAGAALQDDWDYRVVAGHCQRGPGLLVGNGVADMSDDASMVRYNQPQEQQMQILHGKQGALIEDLSNSLKQPGTQAFLIVAA